MIKITIWPANSQDHCISMEGPLIGIVGDSFYQKNDLR